MITLVIPAYNEEKIIEATIKAAESYLEKAFGEYELLVVDDGSLDDTKASAEVAAGPFTRVLSYSENWGKGAAVRFGAFHSKGDVLCFTDADLSYGLELIGPAVEKLKNGNADIVAGSRYLNREDIKNYPLSRRLISLVFKLIVKAALSYSLSDTQCGFKVLGGDAARELFRKCVINGFAFDVEMFAVANIVGATTAEISARVLTHGESKVRVVRDSLKMLCEIFLIRRNIKRGLYSGKKA